VERFCFLGLRVYKDRKAVLNGVFINQGFVVWIVEIYRFHIHFALIFLLTSSKIGLITLQGTHHLAQEAKRLAARQLLLLPSSSLLLKARPDWPKQGMSDPKLKLQAPLMLAQMFLQTWSKPRSIGVNCRIQSSASARQSDTVTLGELSFH